METFHIFDDNKENRIPTQNQQNNLNGNTKVENKNEKKRRVPLSCIQQPEEPLIHEIVNNNSKEKTENERQQVITHCQLANASKEDVIISATNNSDSDDLICDHTEYALDIWKHLYSLEATLTWPKENYMLKQNYINYKMRSMLIDWLATVACEYKFNEQTFHLCVNYIDKFLSYMSVVEQKLQLLGITAMMLAVKVEEIEEVHMDEWIYLTSGVYTQKQAAGMERLLLKVLNFNVNPPTMAIFIRQLCYIYKLDRTTLYMAMFLSELMLVDGESYLKFLPSKLAASAITLARCIVGRETTKLWFDKLKMSTGYDFDQLKPVMQIQYKMFKESPTKREQAIQNKYKKDEFDKVALFSGRVFGLEDCDDPS